jgi:hypothetical protein
MREIPMQDVRPAETSILVAAGESALVRIKRVYEAAEKADCDRFLVDRLNSRWNAGETEIPPAKPKSISARFAPPGSASMIFRLFKSRYTIPAALSFFSALSSENHRGRQPSPRSVLAFGFWVTGFINLRCSIGM